MSRPSTWSEAHLAAHFGGSKDSRRRHTWLTRALQWLGNGNMGRQIVLVRPDGSTTLCRTQASLFGLSQGWHGPASKVIYCFGRSCIHVASEQLWQRRSKDGTVVGPRENLTAPILAQEAPDRIASAGGSLRRPGGSGFIATEEPIQRGSKGYSAVDPRAQNHTGLFSGDTITALEEMVARAERNSARQECRKQQESSDVQQPVRNSNLSS